MSVITYARAIHSARHALGGADTVATLNHIPPGSVFTIGYTSPNWTYNGATITVRPTARTDVRMFVFCPVGVTPPSFPIAGDVLFQVPS